jgi:hypothetical protein
MKEESNISAGTPPTNSVGTGVETSLPPASEPPGIPRGSKVIKRKQKKKIYEAAMVYAFKVTISDLGDIVVYAKNETQVRTKLRDYLRNTSGIINIQRLFATDVIDFYTQKRAKAMKRLPDVVLEQMDKPMEENPQAEKQQLAQNQQKAKQDAAKRMQLQKQQAAKQLQQKKIEMQRNLANQQKTLQAKAKSGSLTDTQAV